VEKYPINKWGISDINKIQTLLTSIRSSRSNKISKGGTESTNKQNAYRHEPIGYKSTLEPKIEKYRDYSTNIATLNQKELWDPDSLSTTNYKKNKMLKYFGGGGRQIFKQLYNKLQKYENLKSLYASNETIKSSLNTSVGGKYGSTKNKDGSKVKAFNNDKIIKKYQKEITLIAKKKRDYMLAQAKNAKLINSNNQTNNVNTTASTIMMSLLGNANNLSITEYPGMNESLVSLNHDFGKIRFGEYAPQNLNVSNAKKSNVGRNSTKKFLRDVHTEVRKKHNTSVDKRKVHDYKRSTGSRKRSEEGTKKKKKSAHVDSGIIKNSCSNSNFPKIDPNVFLMNGKSSKKNLRKNVKKEKWMKRNIIAQNRLGRRKIIGMEV
jgi:hypothetical protein